MSSPQHLSENIKLRLDSELLRRLEVLASRGDRNVSQEMRRALRRYAEQEEAELLAHKEAKS